MFSSCNRQYPEIIAKRLNGKKRSVGIDPRNADVKDFQKMFPPKNQPIIIAFNSNSYSLFDKAGIHLVLVRQCHMGWKIHDQNILEF